MELYSIEEFQKLILMTEKNLCLWEPGYKGAFIVLKFSFE